jgi:hypothetical protein
LRRLLKNHIGGARRPARFFYFAGGFKASETATLSAAKRIDRQKISRGGFSAKGAEH